MSAPRNPTSVLVLGAGMVGTCTALHLAQRGHSVTLIDRRVPGRETSHGNAGIIQREAVEPYAFPREWATLARQPRSMTTVLWRSQMMAGPSITSSRRRFSRM